MRIEIKQWVYEKAQEAASKYGKTLCWDKVNTENSGTLKSNSNDTFYVYGEVEKATEKAILFNLKYWNLKKAGKYITDAPQEDGWKAWFPKSAILNLNEIEVQTKPEPDQQDTDTSVKPKTVRKAKVATDWFEENMNIDKVLNKCTRESLSEDWAETIYNRNLIDHIAELEDEGEYSEADYFRYEYPRLLFMEETPENITFKFDAELDPEEVEQYLSYLGDAITDDMIASAMVDNDTIVISNNIEESLTELYIDDPTPRVHNCVRCGIADNDEGMKYIPEEGWYCIDCYLDRKDELEAQESNEV